ncbi:RNA polymerase sigma factor [Aurantiacibacter aquimixticola]|uniref:Sigma-70 family RNA polymerase sigma factor n=1 Tax=Aurantiacibacter aquimixticola TaxID=1958945 RepID=A0A419RSW9_9SPHN|nr:sigma-70 family RNA polymerase sigma factor [Aurantiacibacter aquimixticola]RJY08875.1 sigma-70 family RNA polymerase sigma factor [Aurantiacibacter aquimixticola]
MARGHTTLNSPPPSQDEAYREAAETYGGAIVRLARGYERDADLARDLVQDIHAALWRSFAYFERQCSVRSWVYRIAHNVAVSHVQAALRRKSGGLVELDEIDTLAAPDNPEADVGEAQASQRLLSTIHRLKPADRQVMLLYLEDLTAAEIGEVTGLSPGAVATRISRVKSLLAESFQSPETER